MATARQGEWDTMMGGDQIGFCAFCQRRIIRVPAAKVKNCRRERKCPGCWGRTFWIFRKTRDGQG